MKTMYHVEVEQDNNVAKEILGRSFTVEDDCYKTNEMILQDIDINVNNKPIASDR